MVQGKKTEKGEDKAPNYSSTTVASVSHTKVLCPLPGQTHDSDPLLTTSN